MRIVLSSGGVMVHRIHSVADHAGSAVVGMLQIDGPINDRYSGGESACSSCRLLMKSFASSMESKATSIWSDMDDWRRNACGRSIASLATIAMELPGWVMLSFCSFSAPAAVNLKST